MDRFMDVVLWFCGLLVVALIALLGYVVWFEVNDPGHGTITGKSYRAASMTCSGKPLICTHHPECYEVRYTDGHHDGDACVSPAEYERYKIGGQFPAAS